MTSAILPQLDNLLSSSLNQSVEDIGNGIFSLLSKIPVENQPSATTEVLERLLATPKLFAHVAKNTAPINIQWDDSTGLWSKVISAMVDQVLDEGASSPTDVFALVRRWSHPKSHQNVFAQKSLAELYWSTVETIAHHPKGEAFIKTIANTKGPVRQWFEDINTCVQWDNKVSARHTVLSKWFSTPLPHSTTTNLLWEWRLRRAHLIPSKIPWAQLGPSPMSDRNLAFLL